MLELTEVHLINAFPFPIAQPIKPFSTILQYNSSQKQGFSSISPAPPTPPQTLHFSSTSSGCNPCWAAPTTQIPASFLTITSDTSPNAITKTLTFLSTIYSPPRTLATLNISSPANLRRLPSFFSYNSIEEIDLLPRNSVFIKGVDGSWWVEASLYEELNLAEEDDDRRSTEAVPAPVSPTVSTALVTPQTSPNKNNKHRGSKKFFGKSDSSYADKNKIKKKLTKTKEYLRLQSELLAQTQTLNFETVSLESSQNLLSKSLTLLEETLTTCEKLDSSLRSIETALIEEKRRFGLDQFLVQAHQLKKLGELQKIYPIREIDENTYMIRDFVCRRDLYSIDDDRLSYGLCMVAHLVFMMSKYLDVPLRYKILGNGSRSAVQDVNVFYPLFKTRVDRERFDKAIYLLERNIDCLVSVRQIDVEGKNREQSNGSSTPGSTGNTGNTGNSVKKNPPHFLKKIHCIFIHLLEPQRLEQQHHQTLRKRTTTIKRRETSSDFINGIYR